MISQVFFVTKNDAKHVLLVANMLGPVVELIVWGLTVDGIAEDSDSCVSNEEMGQVEDRIVSGRVPNMQL